MEKVEEYLEKKKKWSKELSLLRGVLQKTELVEDYKWGVPTYTINGKNVVGMAAFKSYVGLWFFQGVFLKDEKNVLINAQENKTKGLRQWRFNSVDEMDTDLILNYLKEAIENQKQGKEIKVERSKKLSIPMELKAAFKQVDQLEAAFKKLTPGKQKEYAEYINTAKRENTKLSRLEKIIPMIQEGVGLNDKYKNC